MSKYSEALAKHLIDRFQIFNEMRLEIDGVYGWATEAEIVSDINEFWKKWCHAGKVGREKINE
jgi:hypothetical protein